METQKKNLETILQYNKSHREYLENSKNAGCYHCCSIFPANLITEWAPSIYKKGEKHLALKDCAICPNCGVDAILPDYKIILSIPMLRELSQYAFGIRNFL